MPETHVRTCPLCEATCGLEVLHDGDRVIRILGDRDDVFSGGFLCPKGSTLKQLHEDPDRRRRPEIGRGAEAVQVEWDDAFSEVERRLTPIVAEHGRNAVAIYLGNPNVHNPAGLLYVPALAKALGTRNVYSASTVDQMPKHVSAGLMFGHPDSIPVPDLDRTDYLLMLGANPWASNGSLATAPDFPGRIRGIRERGGKVVVVDPRRSRTAEEADEHLSIRPGMDALWLAAVAASALAGGGRVGRLAAVTKGLAELPALLAPFTPEAVAGPTGIEADVTRRIAAEFAGSDAAVAYGRVGTHTTRFGTLASWLVDVINLVTGNLDRPGGAMFPRAAHERPRRRPFRRGRWESRVHGHPEVRGELPVATLAEEILTPGPGQIRALITVAGNPVLSTPDADRLDEAIASLDLVVSVDPYRNETTRHADVLLPPPSALQRSHYDLAFYQLSVRNVVNYSAPLFPLDPGGLDEWRIHARLGLIAAGQGSDARAETFDDFLLGRLLGAALADPGSPAFECDPDAAMAALGGEHGPDRLIDLLIRTGPYGDGFGAVSDGLSLDVLRSHPHGIDLGPLEPRLPDLLSTADDMLDASPEEIVADVPRLAAALDEPPPDVVLVGRRHLRSNNSWMHNVEVLVKGRERCTLQVNPADAERVGVVDGGRVRVISSAGSVEAPVEITDAVRQGVVSLPHGWGHDVEGVDLSVARRRPGVNSNILTDATVIDPLSGNAALNAIPVELSAV
ncbi:MAG TPA: molybdopterin dinucleotide binding domain-containing protein [Acidimicrobiia bacterium]|nr:molybdopterin dinucleotide binding domain-containing protein [Acidimicrobiia bacterium]